MIRLSVVIATFNSGKYLEKVLAAITAQDFPLNEMEVILVDGGLAIKLEKLEINFHVDG